MTHILEIDAIIAVVIFSYRIKEKKYAILIRMDVENMLNLPSIQIDSKDKDDNRLNENIKSFLFNDKTQQIMNVTNITPCVSCLMVFRTNHSFNPLQEDGGKVCPTASK